MRIYADDVLLLSTSLLYLLPAIVWAIGWFQDYTPPSTSVMLIGVHVSVACAAWLYHSSIEANYIVLDRSLARLAIFANAVACNYDTNSGFAAIGMGVVSLVVYFTQTGGRERPPTQGSQKRMKYAWQHSLWHALGSAVGVLVALSRTL